MARLGHWLARQRPYDGTTIARLLETGATLAAVRWDNSGLAMPIGLLICTRRKAWGSLPGDGRIIIHTDDQIGDPEERVQVAAGFFRLAPDHLVKSRELVYEPSAATVFASTKLTT